MPTEFTEFNDITGLGIPHHVAGRTERIWEAESDYTQAGREAGFAVPDADNRGAMTLYTRGPAVEGSSQTLQIQRSGRPGVQGVGLIRQDALDTENAAASPSWPASPWYGQDLPTADTDQRLLVASKSTVPDPETRARDIITLADGTALALYELQVGNRWTLQVQRIEGSDDSVSAAAQIAIGPDANNLIGCLCPVPGGVLCFFWVLDEEPNEWQLRASLSTDGGATWALYQDACLVEALDAANYTPRRRMRARYLNGQVLLVASLRLPADPGFGRDVIGQWASPDGGATFQQITIWDSSTYLLVGTCPELVVVAGRFLFLVIGRDNPTDGITVAYMTRIASAYTPIQITEEDDFAPVSFLAELNAGIFTRDDIAAAVDETAIVWITFRLAQESEAPSHLGQYSMYRSDDFGRTVSGTGAAGGQAAAQWWVGGSNATTPERVSLSYAKGRVQVLHNALTPSPFGASLFLTSLGGQSTRTLPPFALHPTGRRAYWQYTHRPYAQPHLQDPTRYTLQGTGTATLQANAAGDRLVEQLDSPIGQRVYWEFVPADVGSTTEKGLYYGEFEVLSGPVSPTLEQGFKVRIADGAQDYHAGVALGQTGLEIRDVNAGTTLFAADTGVSLAGGAAVLLFVYGGSTANAGQVTGYYRLLDDDPSHTRRWVFIGSTSTLQNNDGTGGKPAAAAGNLVRFGHPEFATAARATNVLAFHDSYGRFAGLGPSSTNASDTLAAIPVGAELPISDSGTGMCFVGAGCWARGEGRAARGDQYTLAPRYRYGVERADVYRHSKPSRTWRTPARTLQRVAWALDGEDPAPFQDYPGSGILFLGLFGINYRTATLQGTVDLSPSPASWTNLVSVDAGAELVFPFTRIGSAIIPAPSATSTRYVGRNELAGAVGAGAYAILDDGAGNVVARRIVKNESGLTIGANSGTQKQLVCWLAGVDNANDPGGGTATIVMPSVVGWRYHTSVPNYRALRLVILAAQNGPETYYETGAIVVGHLRPFGFLPSGGGALAFQHNTGARETRSGQIHTRYRSAGRRERFLPWSDLMTSRLGLVGDAPDPQFWKGSQSIGAGAVANFLDTAQLLEGLLEEMGGPDRPVVFCEGLPLGVDSVGAGSDTGSTARASRFIYGRAFLEEGLDKQIVRHKYEDAEKQDFRLGGITIVEEVGRTRRGY